MRVRACLLHVPVYFGSGVQKCFHHGFVLRGEYLSSQGEHGKFVPRRAHQEKVMSVRHHVSELTNRLGKKVVDEKHYGAVPVVRIFVEDFRQQRTVNLVKKIVDHEERRNSSKILHGNRLLVETLNEFDLLVAA